MIPDPEPGRALWLYYPNAGNGTGELLVCPSDLDAMLARGSLTMNGLHAKVLPPGPYAIRPNVVRVAFEDPPAACATFDPHTTDALRFATKGALPTTEGTAT